MAPPASTSGYGGMYLPQDHVLAEPDKIATPAYKNNAQADDVEIIEQLYGSRKKVRIVFIGAGVSAIDFFKFAETELKNVEVICYEKNPDVGGTWYENKYPGCACDIPSIAYQFPWRPAPWKRYYSYGPEIWEYLKMVANENDFIQKYVRLEHKITKLSWDSETAQWFIEGDDLSSGRQFKDHADNVLNGGGVLNAWKWPDIPGLHDFKGTLLHSAQYNTSVDLKGKRVALIGAGSSGVQILPNIYSDVAQVYTWIRTKIWVTAGYAQLFAGKDGANFLYNDEQLRLLRDPDRHLTYYKMIEAELNQRFSILINGSQAQKDARAFSEQDMKNKLKDKPELAERIMPTDFFVGCRRPTPGNGYLEALAGPKTTAYTEQLKMITEKGFIDSNGKEVEVDVIICATGFDTSFKPKFPLVVDGVDKREEWKDQQIPPSYLSLALAGVPNYFVYAGAHFPAAHGSFYPLIQSCRNYFLQIIEKMQTENIRSLTPKASVTKQFLKFSEAFLKRTAWTGPCSSWFKGGKTTGTPGIYPGSRLHFMRLIERPRFEDYEIDYDDDNNMFTFLGNGFHVCERDGSDITWYLGQPKKYVSEKDIDEVMNGSKGVPMKRLAI